MHGSVLLHSQLKPYGTRLNQFLQDADTRRNRFIGFANWRCRDWWFWDYRWRWSRLRWRWGSNARRWRWSKQTSGGALRKSRGELCWEGWLWDLRRHGFLGRRWEWFGVKLRWGRLYTWDWGWSKKRMGGGVRGWVVRYIDQWEGRCRSQGRRRA